MYKVIQLRYYGENDNRNYPNGVENKITADNLITGEIFQQYTPIVQLGVQHASNAYIPFYINESKNPIFTHPYGLFELDVMDKTCIWSLRFDVKHANGDIRVNAEAPLIVDIVYKE